MLDIAKVDAHENAATLLGLFEAHRFVGVKNTRRALAQGPCDLWLAHERGKLVGALLSVERSCEDSAKQPMCKTPQPSNKSGAGPKSQLCPAVLRAVIRKSVCPPLWRRARRSRMRVL